MAPHSSTLAWKIPWTEEPGEPRSPWGRKESDTTEWLHFHALEKEMATHSSVLAWRIPGTGEPGGLPSMGSHRVGHDWSDLAAVAAGWASPFAVKQILCTELATCKFIMYSFCCFFIIGFSVLQYLLYIYVLFLFGGLYLCPHFSKLPTSHSVFSESHFISQSSSAYLKKKIPTPSM